MRQHRTIHSSASMSFSLLGALAAFVASAQIAQADGYFRSVVRAEFTVPVVENPPAGTVQDPSGNIANTFGFGFYNGEFGPPLVQVAEGKYTIADLAGSVALPRGISAGPIDGRALQPTGRVQITSTGKSRVMRLGNVTGTTANPPAQILLVRLKLALQWQLDTVIADPRDAATAAYEVVVKNRGTGTVLYSGGLALNTMATSAGTVTIDLPGPVALLPGLNQTQDFQIEVKAAGSASTAAPAPVVQPPTKPPDPPQPHPLQPAVLRLLVKDTELAAVEQTCTLEAGMKLRCRSKFRNITKDKCFSQPFFFLLNALTRNIAGSVQPVVTDPNLGGDGILIPGETSQELVFEVTHKNQAFAYYVDAWAAVSDLVMKLEKVSDTVINKNSQGEYSEDTTIRVTAVRSDDGRTLTNFTGRVTIAEQSTKIYTLNTTYGAVLPPSVDVLAGAGGSAEFVARSLAPGTYSDAGPTCAPPNPAWVTTTSHKPFRSAPLVVQQWVKTPRTHDRAQADTFDWVEAWMSDVFAGATGTTKDMLDHVAKYQTDCGRFAGEAGEFHQPKDKQLVTLNPYLPQHRLVHGDLGAICGHPRVGGLRNTLIHEARHVYQSYQSRIDAGAANDDANAATPANDDDQDYLVDKALARLLPTPAPGALDKEPMLDTTVDRDVCFSGTTNAPSERLVRSYRGDGAADPFSQGGPNDPYCPKVALTGTLGLACYAIEEDALAFASNK